MNFRNKTVCVVDHGLFLEVAVKLTKEFGKVLYYCPWESAYPKGNVYLIGTGLPNIRRIKSIWPHLDEVDLWVFPDVYQGPLQLHLEKLGKRVFGGRMGEELELDRIKSKQHCRKIGIDIGGFRAIKGLDELRKYLMSNPNKYVKVSCLRGDFETFHSQTYALVEPRLDELENTLGPRKKIIEFIVEDAIDDAVEIGFDGVVVDGKIATNATMGIEIKDKGFIMKTLRYGDIPDEIRSVNDKLSSTFASYRYRGFFSSELRITRDKHSYLIDPCARCGSPPMELFLEMVKNWGEIFWYSAEGEVVEPQFTAQWGAELMIRSEWADKNWQSVTFPANIRDQVKLRNCTVIEGKYYVAPQWVGVADIGAVVGTGDTQEAAIKACTEISHKIQGYYIEFSHSALEEAEEEWEKLRGFGVKV